MIAKNKDEDRPIKSSYVGYGSELVKIDVEAAKAEYEMHISNPLNKKDEIDYLFKHQTKIR